MSPPAPSRPSLHPDRDEQCLQWRNAITTGTLLIGDGATSPGSLPGNVVISSSTAGALTFNTPAGMSVTSSREHQRPRQRRIGQVRGGILTLSGSNSYTGPISVTAGVVAFSNTGAIFPGSGNIAISSGGVVTGGYSTIGGWLANIAASSAGVLALNSADTETVSMAGYPSLVIGASGAASFSGSFTPAGSSYLLGGGGGTLTFAGPDRRYQPGRLRRRQRRHADLDR